MLALFLCLYVFESPSSLYVSQFPFLEADGGAHTLFIYVLFVCALRRWGSKKPGLGSQLTPRFGVLIKHPEPWIHPEKGMIGDLSRLNGNLGRGKQQKKQL